MVDGTTNGWQPYIWPTSTGTGTGTGTIPTAETTLKSQGTEFDANLDGVKDEVFKAMTSNGAVKDGDLLIKASPTDSKTTRDINGDGKDDIYLEIGGQGYYNISADPAKTAAYGAGSYLYVKEQDVTDDGKADTGYIRMNADGSRSFITECDMGDLKKAEGLSALEKEAAKQLDKSDGGKYDGFAWNGHSVTFTFEGKEYTATITGYADTGNGKQDKGEKVHVVIEQKLK